MTSTIIICDFMLIVMRFCYLSMIGKVLMLCDDYLFMIDKIYLIRCTPLIHGIEMLLITINNDLGSIVSFFTLAVS